MLQCSKNPNILRKISLCSQVPAPSLQVRITYPSPCSTDTPQYLLHEFIAPPLYRLVFALQNMYEDIDSSLTLVATTQLAWMKQISWRNLNTYVCHSESIGQEPVHGEFCIMPYTLIVLAVCVKDLGAGVYAHVATGLNKAAPRRDNADAAQEKNAQLRKHHFGDGICALNIVVSMSEKLLLYLYLGKFSLSCLTRLLEWTGKTVSVDIGIKFRGIVRFFRIIV